MSAPIMYLAARMVLIQYATLDQYSDIINTTRTDVSIIAIISLVRRRGEGGEGRGDGRGGDGRGGEGLILMAAFLAVDISGLLHKSS